MTKIDDRRTNKKLLPDPLWIPDGVNNRLVDILDKDGKAIGNIEVGDDHFVQGVWNVNGLHWRLEYHPSQETALIRAWALR